MGTDDVEGVGTRIDELFETMRAFAEAATDYQRLLDTVAERVTRFMGEGCTIFLATEDGQWLRPAAIYNSDEGAMSLMQSTFSDLPVRLDGESFAAGVMRTGDVAIVPAIDPELAARRYAPGIPAPVAAALSGTRLQSLLCVPLQVHGRRLGVLALSRNRVGETPFSREDETFARTIAEHAALAISNAMLLESQKGELATRRRAEEETKKFVALVQRSRDFIAMAGFDGRVLFVNGAGRELVGISTDFDVTRLLLTDFHTDEGMERAPILRAQGHWEGEGHLRHFGTKSLIPTQISSFLVRTLDGEPLGYATVQRDLRETRRLEAHLRQVQKMEAVGGSQAASLTTSTTCSRSS
jgi:PAS domain S-box-containing protein